MLSQQEKDDLIKSMQEAARSNLESVLHFERRKYFYGDADRLVWEEAQRTATLQLLK